MLDKAVRLDGTIRVRPKVAFMAGCAHQHNNPACQHVGRHIQIYTVLLYYHWCNSSSSSSSSSSDSSASNSMYIE